MFKIAPPEGFIYDDKTGYYYTQEIEKNEEGSLIQHVIWFNQETGEFTDKYYDIPDGNGSAYIDEVEYVDGTEYEDELDDEFQIQNFDARKETKKVSNVVIAGVVGVIVLAVIIVAVVLILKKNAVSDKDAKKKDGTNTENITEDGNSDIAGFDVDPHDYIRTSEKSPIDSYISEYSVVITSTYDGDFSWMEVVGMGDMTGEFLVNPSNRITGESIYTWDFFFNDKTGVRVYGEADCENLSEPKFVSGKEYLRAAVISRNGDSISVLEEIPYYGEVNGFSVDGLYIQKYDESINPYDMSTVEIKVSIGNYLQNGETFATVVAEDGNVISYGANYSSDEDSVMTDGVTEEVAIGGEQGTGSRVDLHSSGMSGFRHAGGFECTDKSLPSDVLPRINLEDDGYCELYANMGDGFYILQGYYEYKEQGEETFIYMHFPDCSDDLSYAELIYDDAIEGGYIYFLTGGFGLMGGDEYYAGHFVRIY